MGKAKLLVYGVLVFGKDQPSGEAIKGTISVLNMFFFAFLGSWLLYMGEKSGMGMPSGTKEADFDTVIGILLGGALYPVSFARSTVLTVLGKDLLEELLALRRACFLDSPCPLSELVPILRSSMKSLTVF